MYILFCFAGRAFLSPSFFFLVLTIVFCPHAFVESLPPPHVSANHPRQKISIAIWVGLFFHFFGGVLLLDGRQWTAAASTIPRYRSSASG
jgi:hypothetical protein